MKHHIIVKWKEEVDKASVVKPVRELFSGCTEIGGVHGCEIIENCVDRPNRYDLMIVISMDADALTTWDESGIHKKWKKEYGESIDKKAIFDCE